ncbi:MAG: hypothetical protein AAGJ08_29740 [Cyanobacteria bacterium P01_H01_bin.35]
MEIPASVLETTNADTTTFAEELRILAAVNSMKWLVCYLAKHPK